MNWSQHKVLVTGAGGFIGSHLCEKLVELGAYVRAFVHYNSAGTRGWLDESPLKSEIEIAAGDVCDRDCVRKSMQGCDVVFHLAALIGIPYSYYAPSSYVRTNIEGSLNVFQSALDLSVARIIHTSSSEVYGTAQYVPIDEDHPLRGQSPYSATKIAADKLAEAFYLSFDLPIATIRPFNTFGPRQSCRAVIPTIITQALAGDDIQLGNLTSTRDLNFVANTVEGFICTAANSASIGQVINIGSGREITIGDLAQTILRLMDKNLRITSNEERMRPESSEVDRLCARYSKAEKLVGWTPRWTLEEGLVETIEWIAQNIQQYRVQEYAI